MAKAACLSSEIWLPRLGSVGLTTATTPGWPFTAFNTPSTTSWYSRSVTFSVSESKTMTSCSAPAAVKSVPISSVTSAESEPVTL